MTPRHQWIYQGELVIIIQGTGTYEQSWEVTAEPLGLAGDF